MDEGKHKKANLITLLIAQGWSPPRPNSEIAHRILDDIERSNSRELYLGPRQRATLQLLAEGMTVSEAAEAQGISAHTIKSELQKAYARLGAKNGSNAIAIALRKGLIE